MLKIALSIGNEMMGNVFVSQEHCDGIHSVYTESFNEELIRLPGGVKNTPYSDNLFGLATKALRFVRNRNGHHEEIKVCTKCGELKPKLDFDESAPGKLYPWCRSCRSLSGPFKICIMCGEKFIPTETHQKTCSNTERQGSFCNVLLAETRRRHSREYNTAYVRRQRALRRTVAS